jgi:predicted transcriptional regulator
MAKTMTLRLDDELGAMLELVARVDEQSLNETVRAAIDAHVAERRSDEAFKVRLRKRHEKDAALYQRLARQLQHGREQT